MPVTSDASLEEEDASLEEEIEAWLKSSASFDEFFPVPRHLGSQWFIINELLKRAGQKKIGFKDLLAVTPSEALRGTSDHQRLSVCLNAIRSRKMEMVKIYDGENEVKELDGASFPVSVTIKITGKMEDAACEYARALLREFYGPRFADEYAAKLLDVTKLIYRFASKTFIVDWPAGITDLVNLTVSAASDENLVKSMVGSSEYFTLIHTLWLAKLRSEDLAGFSRQRLKKRVGRIRSSQTGKWDECIEVLASHGILETVRPDHLRLGDRQAQALSGYGAKLITYRSRLRQEIEELSSAASSGAAVPLP